MAVSAKAPLGSWRELLALWVETANTSLLETQRSEAYLKSQRKILMASTDLRLAQQVVDRRAQVVRQIRRELRQALERALEPIEHAVEGEARLDQLLRHIIDAQPLAERARTDAAGRHAQATRDDGP